MSLIWIFGVFSKSGLFLGVFLYLGFYFQTWGLANTTPSHNALITAGYIVLMPVIIYIFERKHIHIKTIMAGFLTLVGISLTVLPITKSALLSYKVETSCKFA